MSKHVTCPKWAAKKKKGKSWDISFKTEGYGQNLWYLIKNKKYLVGITSLQSYDDVSVIKKNIDGSIGDTCGDTFEDFWWYWHTNCGIVLCFYGPHTHTNLETSTNFKKMYKKHIQEKQIY